MGKSVAIIGYGTGGQAAALALHQRGHDVTIFEKVANPGPVGAGFLLQPTGLQALWQLGLLDQVCRFGKPVHGLYGESTSGRVVMDMHYCELDPRLHGVGLQRGALFGIFHDAMHKLVALHPDHAIVALDVDAGRVQDHRGKWHGPFDLVVVADGSASQLRDAVTPFKVNKPYPWGAFWTLVDQGDWIAVNALTQRYRNARQMSGLLPVGTTAVDGTAKLSFFWSVPVDQMDAWQKGHSWLREFESLWPEAFDEFGSQLASSNMKRAMYRDAIPKQWFNGRAVLLGDSAHAMSPQLGQGVNMALVDAVTLADKLDVCSNLTDAFAAYARDRSKHLAAYHRFSRWLTPLFQSDHDKLSVARDWLFNPLGKMPIGKGNTLRVLTGTQQGWLGRYKLDERFIETFDRIFSQ